MSSFSYILLYLIVLINLSFCSLATDQLFNTWCDQHGKRYSSEKEKLFRQSVFEDNLAYVIQHNSLKFFTYTLALNDFADLTHQEFKDSWLGLKIPALDGKSLHKPAFSLEGSHKIGKIPRSIDWRKNGAVSSVRNQASCGASWAFSAVGAIEGIHKIVTGSLVSLSEQELLDCEKSFNSGCSGGLTDTAFQWTIESQGIGTKEDYPYQAGERACNKKSKRNVVTIDGYRSVPRNDEEQLLQAVASQPVSAGICASERSHQFYSKGIFSGPCSTSLNHAVLIVGYGSVNGVDYWIVKNSWGTNWGINGYMQIQRDSGYPEGVCGINILASYPIKTGSEETPSPDRLVQRCGLLDNCKADQTCCCTKRVIVCLVWTCCNQKNGVCCNDNKHCCPEGNHCLPNNRICHKDPQNNTTMTKLTQSSFWKFG